MFWDHVAGIYDVFVNVINRKTHQKLKEIVSELIEPDDTVLECACGTGLLSAVIAEKCRRLTATDFSEKMLKKAEKNCRSFRNMNRDDKGKTSGFAGAVGKAGADFKRQFTAESYRQFFLDAGYTLASGGPYCDCGYKRKG